MTLFGVPLHGVTQCQSLVWDDVTDRDKQQLTVVSSSGHGPLVTSFCSSILAEHPNCALALWPRVACRHTAGRRAISFSMCLGAPERSHSPPRPVCEVQHYLGISRKRHMEVKCGSLMSWEWDLTVLKVMVAGDISPWDRFCFPWVFQHETSN